MLWNQRVPHESFPAHYNVIMFDGSKINWISVGNQREQQYFSVILTVNMYTIMHNAIFMTQQADGKGLAV